MGIRFNCPNGHKLNVKEFLAGKRGVCPQCGAKFVIPMPAEAAVTESPLPVGIGSSQSVEIAVSPSASHQVASASPSPSPSIIIPVTEIELVPLEPVLQPAVHAPEIPLAAGLPESILAGSPPIVAAPVGVAPEAVLPSPRERSRRNQMVISLLLLALVVLLAGVLVWVLKREANQTPVEKKSAATHRESHQVFAMASSGLLMSAHPRVGALQQ